MAGPLSIEKQTELRRLFDAGVCKNKAKDRLKIAEATVYRYYAKWSALEHVQGKEVFNFLHLPPQVLEELKIQAYMRRISLYNFVLNVLTVVATDNLAASIVDIEADNPVKQRLVDNAK